MSLVGLVLVKLGRTLNELSAITCQLVPFALKILLMAPLLARPGMFELVGEIVLVQGARHQPQLRQCGGEGPRMFAQR